MRKQITFLTGLAMGLMLLVSNFSFSQTATWNYSLAGSSCTAVDMTSATQVALNSGSLDDGGASMTWPFPFYVYNKGYGMSNSLTMNTNGYMRFDANISTASIMPIPSDNLGQFLSYGGNTDGALTGNIVQKVTGSSPNRVWTIAFTYHNHYNGIGAGYSADVQVSFLETVNEIKMSYFNVSSGSVLATNLGLNEGDNTYYTTIATFPTSDTCYTFTPSSIPAVANPTAFNPVATSTSQIGLSWTKNANTNDVIVVYNTTNNFAAPSNGISYSVGNQVAIGQGTILYKGSLSSFSHTSLTPSTKYYYKIYSFNGIPLYSSGILDSATTQSINPPNSFVAIMSSSTAIDLSWVKNSTNHNVMVAVSTTNTFAQPVDGTVYAVGNQIAAGQGMVVYSGSGLTYQHSSLTPGVTYYYQIWSYDGTPYYSSPITANATTVTIQDPTAFSASAQGSSQVDLSWVKNTANNDVLIAYNSTNSFATPTPGITYVVNNQIASGQGTVIYSGSGTTFSQSSLSTGTHYYKAWAFDGSHYYSLGVTDNVTLAAVTDPTSFVATTVSHSQIDLSWTKNTSNQDVMIVRHTSSTFASASNGYTYWVGAVLSANLEEVVYIGSGTSFSDLNLTHTSPYCYKIYAYDASHYYSSGLTACDTTMAPGIITFPYTQDFEGVTAYTATPSCGSTHNLNIDWTNSTSDFSDWVPRTGGTPSPNTGPLDDNTSGSGSKYIYTEATNCFNNTSELESPLFNFVNLANPSLEFYYHMFGNGMGSLSVLVSSDGGVTWSTAIWTKTGPQNSSQASAYNKAQVSLLAYAGMSNIMIKIKGTTGAQYTSDMAIDDIRIYESVPMTYVSSKGVQNTEPVFHGVAGQEIMQIQVVTAGDQTPINATQFLISTAGTTSLADISNIKLYYTGASSTFSTSSQFGSTIIIPGASFPIAGSQALVEDTNYFWLTYDIPTSANYNDVVDACVTQITVGGTNYVPSVTCPVGSKLIKGYQTIANGAASMNTMPIHYDLNAASEFIYTSAEMGAAKDIAKLAFYKASGNNTTQNPQNVSIYLKNTTISSLSSYSYSLAGYTLVYSGAFPNNATSGWMEVTLLAPFTYDGTSNLEVLVSQTVGPNFNAFQAPSWAYGTVSGNRCRYANNNNTAPGSLTLVASNRLPNIRFEYVLPTLMVYSSATSSHPDTIAESPGTTNVGVLRMEIEMNNSVNPMKAKNFILSSAGTTSLSDISNAKIYYSGTNPTLAITNQLGSTIASPTATMTFADSVTLVQGTNYFWLTYDIKSTAVLNNRIDAEFTSVVVGDTLRNPIVSSPNGSKRIRNFVTVGTGTLTNNGNQDGSPYANNYYGAKNQYLLTAADLVAAGVGAGDINSLAFNVANVNSCPALTNFTIRMKSTTATSLTNTWETGVVDYYTIASYQPLVGWNTHVFSTPFVWDGISNVIVETCFNNYSYTNFGNASVYQATKSYTGTHYYRADNTNVCPNTGTTGSSTRLPNMKFDCALPTAMSYVSSEVFHSDTTGVLQGGTNQEIVGVKVVMTANATPLNATSFSIGTNGTTSLSDLTNAKLWYTGTSNVFATTNQFGTSLTTIVAANTITGSQVLANGTNYFWLTYDISSSATLGNYVDAECSSVFVGAAMTPSVTAPVGSRRISGALSGVYTIGTGGDFPSFASASNALNSFGVSGAVIFNVFTGTYTEQVTLNQIAGVSSTNTILIKSQSGDSSDVTLQFASNATNNYVLKLNGTDYCTIQNMTLKSTGSNYGNVIEVANNSDNIIIKSNQILSATYAGANGAGIYVPAAGNSDNLEIEKNYINVYGEYGIYVYGTSTSSLQSGTEIKKNTIIHGRYGIDANYQDAILISENHISQVSAPSSGYSYAVNLVNCNNACEVSKNKLFVKGGNTYLYGIYVGTSSGSSSSKMLIANNFISILSGGNPRGIYTTNASHLNIYYNNIVLNSGGGNGRTIYLSNNSTNMAMQNNNVMNNNGGYAIYAVTGSIGSSNYNNLYSLGGTLGRIGNQNTASLANWKSATSQDANSISVNPSFMSTTDLHVANYAMDKLGSPIAGITTDIDGEVRDVTNPDIGADEFQANYEISVEQFVSPLAFICGGNENIEITIKNNGAVTLTSLTINWSVNSIAQTAFNWTGSLALNATATVNLGTYNFVSGAHTVLVQTISPNGQNDQVQSNDTMSLQVTAHGYPMANAGTDTSVCSSIQHTITSANATSYLSLNWTTSGTGTFANGTTLSPTYTPSSADTVAGMVYLILTVNGQATCGVDVDSMSLTFLNAPNPSISGLDANYCFGADADTLIGLPAGGTFSGTGMSGAIFDPVTAGAGVHTIDYIITNSGGCVGTASVQTSVYTNTVVSITGLSSNYCVDAATVALTLTPFGGTLSGTGIVGTSFIPSVAGVGSHTITYDYTDANGCNYVVTEMVTVDALPVVSFTGLNLTYCSSVSPVVLTGTPALGTFAGTGITGNSFDPATAGVGNHAITYTYQDGNGCSNTATQNVDVYASPVVSFTGLDTMYCLNNGLVSITGNPVGGSFTGSGMTGNSFDPTTAGAGTHTITYSLTDANVCTGTISQDVTVYSVPVANAGSDANVNYLATYNLTGSATGGTNNYSYVWAPADSINGSANVQNPTTNAILNTTVFTLSVTDAVSGCMDDTIVTLTPTGGPLNATAIALDDSLCMGDNTTLSSLPSGGTGTFTYAWSSMPVGFTSTASNPTVNPSVTTTYTVAVTSGAQTVNSSVVVEVSQVPTVYFNGLLPSYCESAPSQILVGTPAGGTFVGNGMNGNIFDPSIAGAGSHSISYTFTNSFGCSSDSAEVTMINASPVAMITAPDSVLYGTDTVLIASVVGGTSTYTYEWSPASAIMGNATAINCTTQNITTLIDFSLVITDDATSCTDSISHIIFPYGGPLAATATAAPDTICYGSTTQLDAIALGGTGTYAYSWASTPVGYTSALQNPVVAPTVSTTYTVTVDDGTASPVVANVEVFVSVVPNVSFTGLSANYCTSSLADTLIGTPAGGMFTGTGLTGNIFDPSIAGSGNFTITYSYTDMNGCVGTDMQGVNVSVAPVADAGMDITMACGTAAQTIGSASTVGLVYSWTPTLGLSDPLISNPVANPSLTTIYTLTVLDTISGCFSTDDIMVTVTGGPIAVGSQDTIICIGGTATLNVMGGVTYMWSTTDVTSTVNVSPITTTTYVVTVYDAGGCADSDSIDVIVNNPVVNLGNDTTIKIDQSIILDAGFGFVDYDWSTGDITQTVTIDSTVLSLGLSSVMVTVTDNIGCTASDTISITVLPSAIEDVVETINLQVYPNPSKGLVTIKIDDYKTNQIRFDITDLAGRVLYSEQLSLESGNLVKKMDLSTFAKGVYLMRFVDRNMNKTERLIIQ